MAVVCFANICLWQMIIFKNKIFSHHLPKSAIFDCNSPTSVTSQLQRPFDSCFGKFKIGFPFSAVRFQSILACIL
jgi:hypothetical protein